MDLLDLLDEIIEAERPVDDPIVRRGHAVEMLPCGVHEAWRGDDEHVAECWGGVCPSCGDEVLNGFLYRLNHSSAEHGLCGSIQLRLNHLSAAMRFGNHHAVDARDLGVLDLGYLIGPDGSQIHPNGRVDPCLTPYAEAELFARWAA